MKGPARLNSQSQAVLAQLKAGRRITQLDALDELGCARLAARIHELREAGHAIKSESVTTPSGARIAEYRLERPEYRQEGLFA